jgi:MFS family permease
MSIETSPKTPPADSALPQTPRDSLIDPERPEERSHDSYFTLILSSLGYRNFRLVWLGSLTEHFGEFMEVAAILWLVNEMTHSPLMLTIVGSCRFLSMVFFSVLGGIVADRVGRRGLLIAALLGSCLISTCLSLLVVSKLLAVWHLVVISLLMGVVMSFNHPARQAMVPNLVERKHLLNAVSLDALSVQGSRLGGMLTVGYLLATVEVGLIFVLRALGCLLAILWLFFARIPPPLQNAKTRSPWRSFVEGFHYIRGSKFVLALTLVYFVPWITMNTCTSFLPVFAKDILRVGPVGYGYLQAASGLGAVLSLMMITMVTYYKRKLLLIIVCGLVLGITMLGFSASPWITLSLLLLVIMGGMQNGFIALNTALVQEVVPDDVRGRVMSWREVIFGLGPTGGIVFGMIAQYTGVPVSLGLLAGICVVVFLLLIPLLRREYPAY